MNTATQQTEIVQIVESNALGKESTDLILKSFQSFFEKVDGWEKRAKTLEVTSVDQKAEMKMAREARLALRAIRIDADKTRKELKEESLRYGRAVQGVYNIIEYKIKPLEEYLHKQEKYAEIQRQKELEELKEARLEALEPYQEYVPFGIDLMNMEDEEFAKLLNGAKLQMEQVIAEQARLEKERIERERIARLTHEREIIAAPFSHFMPKPDVSLGEIPENEWQNLINNAKSRKAEHDAEQERIRKENERLKAERIEAERQAKAEAEKLRKQKEKAEAAARAAKAKQAKMEAEIKAKKAEEEKARKAEADRRAEAERQARLAPDKDKLLILAEVVSKIEIPNVESDEAKDIAKNAKALLVKVEKYIQEKSKSL